MAKRVVDEASLTAVADAIRETGVTDEAIAFPEGFVNEYEYIADMYKGLIEKRTNLQVFFPKGLEVIGKAAFDGENYMHFPVVFPEGIKEIRWYAFHACWNIREVVLPASLELLDSWAFVTCYELRTVTFKGKPARINTDGGPFDQCPNLTVINVPWAEGEVAGAPWGATNATINYNYVAEG